MPVNTAQYMSPPAAANQVKAGYRAALIDNIAKHPTPEGLLLTLMPAGLMPRLWAWLIDLLIRAVIMIIVGMISIFFGTVGTGITAIAYFLISWLYPVYFEVYRGGMTPGKKSQGIYVCHDDGTPISLQSSMIRNLLLVADFLPFGFATGILAIMFTQRSQRIGDIVAGTLVVYKQQDDLEKLYKNVYGYSFGHSNDYASKLLKDTTSINAQNSAFDRDSPLFFYPLRLNEQQALVSYVERLDFLSEARQQEIAYALAPLVKTQIQTPQAKKHAVQQAVFQKAMMIQGQTSTADTDSSIDDNKYYSDQSAFTAKQNTHTQQDGQR